MSSKDCGYWSRESASVFRIGTSGVCCTLDYRNNFGGGRVVIAQRYDSDDSHRYHWEYCCEFSHVQPWMVICSLASGGLVSSFCWCGFHFAGNLMPPKRILDVPWDFIVSPQQKTRGVDIPRLLEFRFSGFCLLEKLSESIKGFSVNYFFMNMTFLMAYDKCFILPK